MYAAVPAALGGRFGLRGRADDAARVARPAGLSFHALPVAARIYVWVVVVAGTIALIQFVPRTIPDPALFAAVLLTACVTAAWKVNLPIPLVSGSTLSVSYAAKLMALLLLGPQAAVVVAVAGALTQCTYHAKQPYPLYRTIFSIAAEAITMGATGVAYTWLGGSTGPFELSTLAKPLVGAIAAYFVFNTGLVAAAIGLSTDRPVARVWRDDFLWSGVTYMVAGSTGAMAAVVIERGEQWMAVLLLAPVYLTYRTYELFAARLDDQQRHMAEMSRVYELLAAEKERVDAARAAAEEANRLKDQFLAIISHELRTPLNAILGWADMLCGGKLDSVQADRAHHVIYGSAKRQAQLIEDLLDVARIMAGKLRLERHPLDMHDVAREAISSVQPIADGKQIAISLQVDPALRGVDGDRDRLVQITWNLLSNAIKFTPDGGAVRVALRADGNELALSVTDSGQGIPRDFLPWVFEPFRQADGSNTRTHGGLGLGLSIVKQLVEAHGGTVSAASEGEGRGSTFVVRLPMMAVSFGLASATLPAPVTIANAGASLAGMTVLIVDDDEASRQVAAAHLEGRQATALTAASAAEAMELLQQHHIDVLLADLAMPGEDGLALIRRIRSSPVVTIARVPAAAVTAFSRREDHQQTLAAGFQMHLAKPLDAESLVSAVIRLRGTLAERRRSARRR